jgi:hypothetical protein
MSRKFSILLALLAAVAFPSVAQAWVDLGPLSGLSHNGWGLNCCGYPGLYPYWDYSPDGLDRPYIAVVEPTDCRPHCHLHKRRVARRY